MKNSLEDLNNHLFAQMERLSNEDLSADDLKKELDRTKALVVTAREIIDNGKLVLDAAKSVRNGMVKSVPKMLGDYSE